MNYNTPIPSEAMQSSQFRAQLYCRASVSSYRAKLAHQKRGTEPDAFTKEFNWCNGSVCESCILSTSDWSQEKVVKFLE